MSGALTPAERPVVVTGASSGIGEATARLLASDGHPVVLGARRVEVCERIAEDINAGGGRAYAIALDLADEASISAFVKAAEASVGVIEVLVSGMIAALTMELEGTGVRVSTIRPGATFTGMGMDWDPAVTGTLYQDWKRRGLQLHDHLMAPADVAAAIRAEVAAPPGVVFRSIEVEPLFPVTEHPLEAGR